MPIANPFAPATKERAYGRIALIGPAGSGKSYTGLMLARTLVGPEGRIAGIDTEHGSMAKYANLFAFDHAILDNFRPQHYIDMARAAEANGYDALLIDSASHAWAGKGGLLEQVDNYGRTHGGNSFGGWRDATPQHQDFIEALLSLNMHLIVTMRSKMEYLIQQNDRGKAEPVKVGLAPVQRDGMEYEFDLIVDLTVDNVGSVGKTRCPELRNYVANPPTEELGVIFKRWLDDGSKPLSATDMRDRAMEAWDDMDALQKVRDLAAARNLMSMPVQNRDGDGQVPLGVLINERGRALWQASRPQQPSAPAVETPQETAQKPAVQEQPQQARQGRGSAKQGEVVSGDQGPREPAASNA